MTTFQAIPPVNLFAVPPTATITGDGVYLVQGAVPAIFPGPLVMPLFASQVSDAGRAQILAWAVRANDQPTPERYYTIHLFLLDPTK